MDNEDAFDPSRALCPDGTCVGVLGADDRCRVCGARGGEGAPGLSASAFGGGCLDERGDEATAFDATRRLCPDGSCVGVIGPDLRCGECGRVAQEA